MDSLLLWSASAITLLCSVVLFYKLYAKRQMLSCMTMMLLTMTVGTFSGLITGTLLAGILSFELGCFIGSIIGVTLGALFGILYNILTVIEGVIGGIMGGLMGAMLGAMLSASAFSLMLILLLVIYVIMTLLFRKQIGQETVKTSKSELLFSQHNIITVSSIMFVAMAFLLIGTLFYVQQPNEKRTVLQMHQH